MGKLHDLKCRMGMCSFYEAEEYADRKRAEKEAKMIAYQYRVTFKMPNGQQFSDVFTAKKPGDAVHSAMCIVWGGKDFILHNTELKTQRDVKMYANCKVENLTSSRKSVHYYRIQADSIQVNNARIETEQRRKDWERREQNQGIY